MTTRRGFSLVEAVVAVAIVGVMLVGALTAVGASRVTQFRVGRLRQGYLLAEALMAEVLQQPYEDAVTGAIGLEASEWTGTRTTFDDVDDYAGWTGSPPQLKDGTVLTQFADYRRRVAVKYADPMNLNGSSAIDLGIKRITVSVDVNDNEIASLVAIRTRAKDELTP
ncbi:hypothetical protein LCGC14_0162520 [marine sediment metagenome]|uniref:Type II secretion system protein GspI C-terminal domain-containing protein n=1 Tax=marine sediment metagenome TaxID=412755 RepID=A0A0F9XD87_9ZZZZ